jgi:alpha/beta superfamily hydrolase
MNEHALNTEAGAGNEAMLPYFFGSEPARLYGCHHAPAASGADVAVLICNATGHEYERCHRATRQLAVQFTRAGFSALRFDYFGTGDSSGDLSQATLAQWRRDVNAAADECLRLSGCERLCVVGVRMGAAIAAQAVALRTDVTDLVLYAPVLNGAALLAEWQAAQLAFDRKHSRATIRAPQELMGYPLTDALRGELASGLSVPVPPPGLRRALILAEDIQTAGIVRTAALLGSGGAAVTVEPADGPAVWRHEPLEGIVPFKLLRRIVAWAGESP